MPVTLPNKENFKAWWEGGNDSWGQVEILKDLNDRYLVTPDLSELNKQEQIPVLIYDNMMSGLSNHEYIKEGVYYGVAHTMTDRWTMKANGYAPIVFPNVEKDLYERKYAYVRGQMWGLTPEHIHTLDQYFVNGKEYQRVGISVYAEDQTSYNIVNAGRTYHKVWAYVGIPEFHFRNNQKLDTRPITTYKAGCNAKILDKPLFEWKSLSTSEPKINKPGFYSPHWSEGYPGVDDDGEFPLMRGMFSQDV